MPAGTVVPFTKRAKSIEQSRGFSSSHPARAAEQARVALLLYEALPFKLPAAPWRVNGVKLGTSNAATSGSHQEMQQFSLTADSIFGSEMGERLQTWSPFLPPYVSARATSQTAGTFWYMRCLSFRAALQLHVCFKIHGEPRL